MATLKIVYLSNFRRYRVMQVRYPWVLLPSHAYRQSRTDTKVGP